MEIIPTYVPADADDLGRGAALIRAFAKAVHIDIDDGLFAPHTTWPYRANGVFGSFDLSGVMPLEADIHLMVENPKEIGVAFAHAGAKRIMGHVEAFESSTAASDALETWRSEGAEEVGLGILFATPFDVIAPLVPRCDVVHLMTIATIGTQGIPYEANAPARVREFHERFPVTLISVDGGVSKNNISDLARAGAARFGVGSAISKAPDPKAAYGELKTLAENAVK